MKDYWSKLNLSQRWSARERFNYIMNYIDSKADDKEDEGTG